MMVVMMLSHDELVIMHVFLLGRAKVSPGDAVCYFHGYFTTTVTPLSRDLLHLLPNSYVLVAFSALTLLVGRQEGIRSIKNGGMVEVGTD